MGLALDLAGALDPRAIPYCPHIPTAKQQEFLDLTCREALYGGAAGGGKSDALLMGALQYVRVEGYRALLLRRTFADLALPGALMDRADHWLRGTDAKWQDKEKTWLFPSGATITFGYLETDKDRFRYQGAEFQFVGFDELTQFSDIQYRYLISRIRRLKGVVIPLRLRAASNPGGVGHEWVRQRFLVEGPQAGRPFISARIDDNPHLDADEYKEGLQELDPVTRAQLLAGDWDIRADGKKFKREWFRPVNPDEIPEKIRWARFWDLAATEAEPGKDPDWTAGALVGISPDGFYFIADVRRMRGTPGKVEQYIRRTAQEDGAAVPVYIEQEPGSAGVTVIDSYVRRVLQGFTCRGMKTTGPKEVRANPVSSQAEAGNVHIVRGAWTREFLDEAAAFPSEGVHDDQVDAVSGAFAALQKGIVWQSW